MPRPFSYTIALSLAAAPVALMLAGAIIAPTPGHAASETPSKIANSFTVDAGDKFGYGYSAQDVARIVGSPGKGDLARQKQWVLDQIGRDGVPSVAFAGLRTAAQSYAEMQKKIDEKITPDAEQRRKNAEAFLDITVQKESLARLRAAATSTTPFTERLVAFWANHFNIQRRKDRFVGVTVGGFEREAIRPYVHGRFPDMLVAVVKHPTMLRYLDNYTSFITAKQCNNGKGGLNENLGRETLELYTLGVNGGYTQADVQELAKALTGWTIKDGTFAFRPECHDAGARQILSKTYPAGISVANTEQILRDLAMRPATARFLARKLAIHFINDTPPQPLINQMASAYLASGGSLAAMYKVLITDDTALKCKNCKLKSPYDLVVSSLRSVSFEGWQTINSGGGVALNALTTLGGYALWEYRTPDGWPDSNAFWLTQQFTKTRTDWCYSVFPRLVAAGKGANTPAATTHLAFLQAKTGVTVPTGAKDLLSRICASPDFQYR